jgi:hypothetical protein
VPVLVPCPENAISGLVFAPDLARVVDSWDRLPEAIRTAILALIQAFTDSSVRPTRLTTSG